MTVDNEIKSQIDHKLEISFHFFDSEGAGFFFLRKKDMIDLQ
jgi:hypothetical protein